MDLMYDLIGNLIETNKEISKIIDIHKLCKQPNFIVEKSNSSIYMG